MFDILELAARKAGQIQIEHFQKGVSAISKTSHQNLATEIDFLSQSTIRGILLDGMVKKGYKSNEVGFIGEENLNTPKKYTFVIDPIDGTTNFITGIDFFGISIALIKDEIITHGLIYDPIKKISYYAQKSKGATKNGKKLTILPKSLNQCVGASYFTSDKVLFKNIISILTKLCPHLRGFRVIGSAVGHNAQLLDNIIQLYFESHTFIWDFAASQLLIEESGGIYCDYKGQKLNLDLANPDKVYQVLACHPSILSQILPYFA